MLFIRLDEPLHTDGAEQLVGQLTPKRLILPPVEGPVGFPGADRGVVTIDAPRGIFRARLLPQNSRGLLRLIRSYS